MKMTTWDPWKLNRNRTRTQPRLHLLCLDWLQIRTAIWQQPSHSWWWLSSAERNRNGLAHQQGEAALLAAETPEWSYQPCCTSQSECCHSWGGLQSCQLKSMELMKQLVIIYDLSPISDTRFQFSTYSFTSHYFRACLNWRFAAQSSNLTPPLSSDSLHPHPAGTPRRTLPRASRVPLPTIRWTERWCCFAAY